MPPGEALLAEAEETPPGICEGPTGPPLLPLAVLPLPIPGAFITGPDARVLGAGASGVFMLGAIGFGGTMGALLEGVWGVGSLGEGGAAEATCFGWGGVG